MGTSSVQKALWIGLAFAIAIGGIWQFFPLSDAKKRLDQMPLNGPDFSGKDVLLTSFEQTFFKNINLLKRTYKVGNQTIFMYALDGTHNRHLVHDPFYCFRGGGWNVVSQKPMAIPGGTGNLVRLVKDGQTRETLYWFSNGASHYMSPIKYWWQTMLRRLTFGRSGAEPVLIVIQPVETESLDWKKLSEDFKPIFLL